MGKPEDRKKPATKARRRSARKLKTTMAIIFEEVNGHHNVLVAARARHVKSAYPDDDYQAKTDSKAVNLNVDFNDREDAFRARIEAVSGFLHKVSRSEDVTLIISDAKFIQIIEATEPDAAEAIASWNELSEKFKNLSVVIHSGEDTCETLGHNHLVACSNVMLKAHKNSL